SFSEHPFYCEIMPESILARKIALLCMDLLTDETIIRRWKPWRKLSRRRIKASVMQYASSPDYDRAQSVFNGFGLGQIGFFLIFLRSELPARRREARSAATKRRRSF